MSATTGPRVEMRGISKSFLDVRANRDVNLQVHPGEIVALLGENGAGKTTLMNILYGFYQADEGTILIDGREVRFRSPSEAIRAGVGMIHQHFTLVPALTVLENLMLGPHGNGGFIPDRKGCRAKALRVMESSGLPLDPDARAGDLPVGQQQKAEIVKALYRGAKVLIMDEPTAVLTPQEAEELFKTISTLVQQGLSVILISHKMKEIMRVTDRIYILRHGECVAEKTTKETNPAELARLMVGHAVEAAGTTPRSLAPGNADEVVLRVEGLGIRRHDGVSAVEELSFDVRRGEILGLAGVSGNGQTELCEVLFGLRPTSRGTVRVGTEILPAGNPRRTIRAGVARIPEDRMTTGLMLDLTVEDNLFLRHHAHPKFRRAGAFLRHTEIGAFSQRLIDAYSIRTDGAKATARSLSGGNLQKIILARELEDEPGLIIASQPTRGLDIGATGFIHQRLLEERAKGAGILLVSDDLDEILELADRVAVLYEGRIMGTQDREAFDRDTLGLWMGGARS